MRRREFIAGLASAALASSSIWPLAARAQQPAVPVIGFLTVNPGRSEAGYLLPAFHRGLGEEGYAEGRNVKVLYQWAGSAYDRLPALAADLVRRRVAVIVATGGTPVALAAKSATATIPIVLAGGGDPVELGLVASLNRPGGNVTGVSFVTVPLIAKRLELLHQLVPAAATIGFLVNPRSPQVAAETKEAEKAAGILGVRLAVVNASTPDEIERAFATLAEQRIGALLSGADALFGVQHNQLAALAARHALPAIYHTRDTVEVGGLMSYGGSISDAWRLAGIYAGRILKGEKPAELPVQQSTKIEMVINLKTAKALGLTFPVTLLAVADEVIE
jgi:putative ABC transport system substrate-binding protein